MRLTTDQKRAITEQIRSGAAALFRERGYDDVSLDDVMQRAHLTRGAFYAHDASKDALLVDIVRHEHPLLRMLEARPGSQGDMLWEQMMEIFSGYLSPDNLDEVFEGCSLAALTGDVARASVEVREAYEAAFQDILEEISREQPIAPEKFAAPLVLASGAVRMARAMAAAEQRVAVLAAAQESFVDQMQQIRRQPS